MTAVRPAYPFHNGSPEARRRVMSCPQHPMGCTEACPDRPVTYWPTVSRRPRSRRLLNAVQGVALALVASVLFWSVMVAAYVIGQSR